MEILTLGLYVNGCIKNFTIKICLDSSYVKKSDDSKEVCVNNQKNKLFFSILFVY